MKKEFLDEVMEELQKLKDQSKEITISVPIAPHEVLKAIGKVVKNYEFSADELGAMMGLREMTKADFEMLNDLREAEGKKK